ncbi:MAG: PAS domain S-box protein [Anaerolineae bacterium]|nr:PAS domain S-box protein [Anaerolineae bacterium]
MATVDAVPHPVILIVDDDTGTRLLIRRVLQALGYTLLEAENGHQALSLLEDASPALVILDVMMPGINGIEVCRHIRESNTTTPILMLTGLSDEQAIENAFLAGADDFVTKPPNWAILKRRVSRMVAAYLADKELADYQQHLEQLVGDRTAELRAANQSLQQEIAERERAEQTSEQSKDRLRIVLENMPVMLMAIGDDGTPVIWNRECERVTGYSAAEMLGQANWLDILYPDAEYRTSMTEAAHKHSANYRNWEWATTCKDGDIRFIAWSNISSSLVIPGWSSWAIGMDVTTRRLIEEALYRSEEQIRRITDNMLDIICQTDMDGVIQYASPSCYSVLGYEPEAMIEQSIYAGIHPEDVETVKEAVQTTGRVEYRYQHANGDYVWLETLSNFLFADTEPEGIIFASRDITRRKQAERELKELNRLKTEFLSTAAHELRTPLTSIRGFSEILLTRQLDDPRKQRYLSLINEQSTHLGTIIDDLLDVSRLEAKRNLALTLEPIYLPDLINHVVAPFAESSGEHRIQIEGFEVCPPLNGDPFRLAQVVKNLLSNAVKYSPSGSLIQIQARVLPECVEISVQDQGVGMTAEQQAHLFEKFYRADASNTAISGTGLGLAISKLIVELHGGKIWAESQYGVGTTFYFTLPLTTEQAGVSR